MAKGGGRRAKIKYLSHNGTILFVHIQGSRSPNQFEHHSIRALAQSQEPPQESMDKSQVLHHYVVESFPVQTCSHMPTAQGREGSAVHSLGHESP